MLAGIGTVLSLTDSSFSMAPGVDLLERMFFSRTLSAPYDTILRREKMEVNVANALSMRTSESAAQGRLV